VDVIAAAGEHYLEIVAPSNCVIDSKDQMWSAIADDAGELDSEDWDRIQEELLPLYADLAEADIAFVEALVAYDWPESVDDDIDGLVQQVSAEAALAQDISEVASFVSFAAILSEPQEDQANFAAIVRAKLGLATNIGATAEAC
jgi:hypothetical protein